jgi:aspartate kinase
MKVFKFGGGSIQHADAIKQLVKIVTSHQDEKLVIVVSAMGKTTQGLEKAFQHKLDNQPYEAAIQAVFDYHRIIIENLFGDACQSMLSILKDWKNQIKSNLQVSYNLGNLDKRYSSIVALGEVLSSQIIHYYIQTKKVPCIWLDARDSIKTQQGFRDASINWKATRKLVKQNFFPLLSKHPLILTQGFIGSNQAGETTTLGKEGSDFTGAILATILKAQSLTIWKNVSGIMNADPKRFPDTVQFDQISYEEMAKMAFYGAQVVHPQAIRPLAENDIPLHVKSFLDWQAPGTVVRNSHSPLKRPIYIIKLDQRLIQLRLKSLAFLDERHMAYIFKHLARLSIQVNMCEKTAYSLTLCLNSDFIRIKKLTDILGKKFLLYKNSPASLLTVMHQAHGLPPKYLQDKTILLEQQCQDFYQAAFTTEPSNY